MATGFGLDRAKDIRRPATFILAVPTRLAARLGRRRRTNVGMQRDRLLVETDHRLRRIVGPFVRFQHVFHAGDVGFIELRHAPHFFPATA